MTTVVHKEALPALIRQHRARIRAEWERFPHAQRFIEDHFPGPWENIRQCRLRYKTLRSTRDPTKWKIAPTYCCRELPFCIHCVNAARHGRITRALNNLHRCTPKGKEVRVVALVQTAPIYDDFTGWGVEASQDFGAFGALVFENLQEFYGEGIGSLMSYQDFGEQAFAKRHPHQDLIVNGWKLQDGQPVLTPTIELKGGGLQRWNQAIAQRATRFRIDAKTGNVRFEDVKTGAKAAYGVLKYKMRELVDFRKIAYNRDQQRLWWISYDKTGRVPPRTAFDVKDFKAGLAEYQWRLGQWPQGDDEGKELHRYYGHMAKRSIRATQKIMGGEIPPHGKDCPCSECGDWERVILDEVEEAVGWARPIGEV